MDKKVILCFIGRSGCGKDTIVNKFLSQNEKFNKSIFYQRGRRKRRPLFAWLGLRRKYIQVVVQIVRRFSPDLRRPLGFRQHADARRV